jgi:phytoene synthase
LARTCGEAFQLTNILRDLCEDAARERVYLPLEDLERFDVAPADVLQARPNAALDDLLAFEIARAEGLYDRAADLEGLLSPGGRRVFLLMFGRYRAILAQIKRRPRDVWRRRISLTLAQKARIAVGAVLASLSPPRSRPAAQATPPQQTSSLSGF